MRTGLDHRRGKRAPDAAGASGDDGAAPDEVVAVHPGSPPAT
jgi:hypothetical protein